MRIVALTGGLACGKSLVGKFLMGWGIPVVDADRVVHRLLMPGSDCHDAVVGAFGREVLGSDGRIDRRKLGEIVFRDEHRRRRLESLVHPRLMKEVKDTARLLNQLGFDVMVLEAAMVIESGMAREFHKVVLVVADEKVRLQRARSRLGLDSEQVLARMRAQWPDERKLPHADFVVRNDGTLADLRREVARVAAALYCEEES